MEGHYSDDQNKLNWLTVSNIINQTVKDHHIGIRTKQELKLRKSKSSVQVDLPKYPIWNLVNMEWHYSDDQNQTNQLMLSNIINRRKNNSWYGYCIYIYICRGRGSNPGHHHLSTFKNVWVLTTRLLDQKKDQRR
jgi:hypothetical protein